MKRFLLIIGLTILSISIFAQAPDYLNYQAVVRDNTGAIIGNGPVSFRFSIHEVNAGGEVIYLETHAGTTNEFGLINLKIGEGTVVFGTFSNIDWGNSYKFLEVEVDQDGGSNYLSLGTTQMASVPYALYAAVAAETSGGDNDWTILGNNMYSAVSGNVGIGTSTPLNRLHVTGSESSPLLKVHKTGAGRGVQVYTTSACALWVENAGNHGLRISHANGNGVNVTNANGSGIYVSQAGNWAGYFNGTGYFADEVGIGTTTPAAKLDVNGNIISDYPVSSNHVATKQYVDDQVTKYEQKIEELEQIIFELKEILAQKAENK